MPFCFTASRPFQLELRTFNSLPCISIPKMLTNQGRWRRMPRLIARLPSCGVGGEASTGFGNANAVTIGDPTLLRSAEAAGEELVQELLNLVGRTNHFNDPGQDPTQNNQQASSDLSARSPLVCSIYPRHESDQL